MIVSEGPGKIIMPDGTEIDVIFERHEIRFDSSDIVTVKLAPYDRAAPPPPEVD
jgi:hypothetical protein